MEMSIAIDWGKERLLRWALLLHRRYESFRTGRDEEEHKIEFKR